MPKKRPSNIDNDLDHLDLENKGPDELHSYPDDLLTKNGNGILIYNDKKFAVGLTWLTSSEFEDNSSVYKKAKDINCDFYCSRTFVSQNGFGTIKLKHKMGMESAAATAADALVGEWHGVFAADNGWHYVAVHSDNIAPEGDLFFLSEEEAYNHFVNEAKKYKWPKTYVLESWNIENNDGQIDFSQLIEDISSTTLKPANLNAFFGSAANKSLAIISILCIGGFLALMFLSQSLFNQIIPERASAPSARIDISDALTVPPQEPVFKADPVQELINKTPITNSAVFVGLCLESFDELMVSIPGWSLDTMKCRGNLVEATWRRGIGSLETLRDNVDQFPAGVSKTYGSSGNFLASKIISGLNSYDEQLVLYSREETLVNINNLYSGIGSLQVKDIAPMANANNQRRNQRGSRQNELITDENQELTLQNLPALSVVLKSDISPIIIKKNFDYPGLKINVIEWDLKNGDWTYDMQVYLYPDNYKPNERL